MSNSKEKARELFNKYADNFNFDDTYRGYKEQSKECALIAVSNMIDEYQSMSDLESKIVINDEVKFVVHQLIYWMEVKQEIEKL